MENETRDQKLLENVTDSLKKRLKSLNYFISKGRQICKLSHLNTARYASGKNYLKLPKYANLELKITQIKYFWNFLSLKHISKAYRSKPKYGWIFNLFSTKDPPKKFCLARNTFFIIDDCPNLLKSTSRCFEKFLLWHSIPLFSVFLYKRNMIINIISIPHDKLLCLSGWFALDIIIVVRLVVVFV